MWLVKEIKNINDELNKHKLNFRAEELFNFIKESLEARELSKFEFINFDNYLEIGNWKLEISYHLFAIT